MFATEHGIGGGEAIGLFLCVLTAVFLDAGKWHSGGLCGLHAFQLVFESELESKCRNRAA